MTNTGRRGLRGGSGKCFIMLHSRHGIGFWGWETVSFKKKKKKQQKNKDLEHFWLLSIWLGEIKSLICCFFSVSMQQDLEFQKQWFLLCTNFTRKKCQITRWTLQIHSENKRNLWPRLTKKTHSVLSLHDCYDSGICWEYRHVQLTKITLSEVRTMHGYRFL